MPLEHTDPRVQQCQKKKGALGLEPPYHTRTGKLSDATTLLNPGAKCN